MPQILFPDYSFNTIYVAIIKQNTFSKHYLIACIAAQKTHK